MLRIGLTGNVAAGKSTVTGAFARWGATVVDADVLVREVQAPGSPVLDAIATRFGRDVLDASGHLDRARLRGIILDDAGARDALNAIVHPAVHAARREADAAARARRDCMIVHDIPLLFEVLDPGDFDVVVLVDAPTTLRRDRLVAHRGLSAAEADRLIAAQLPSADKRSRSHVVLDNDTTIEALHAAAWDAWLAIRARAARAGGGEAPPAVTALRAGELAAPLRLLLARAADAGAPHRVLDATGDPIVIDPHPRGDILLAPPPGSDAHRRAADWAAAAPGATVGWLCAPGEAAHAATVDVRPWGHGDDDDATRRDPPPAYVHVGTDHPPGAPVDDLAGLLAGAG